MTKYETSKPKDVEIYKVDIDEQEDLVDRFNISAMPTLLYFKDGKLIAQEPGIKSVSKLKKNVEKYFK